MTTSDSNPTSATIGKLEITNVVIDLPMGLFAFTYADGITEHVQIRDHTDVPTVSNLLTALIDEVVAYGRPQRRQRPMAHDPAASA